MNTIVSLFNSRLDEIERHVHLLNKLRTLGSVAEARSIRHTRLGQATLDLRRDIKSCRSWETIGIDGCVLSLCGEFELAARDLAERASELLAAKFKRYSHLPESIRLKNVELVGELLSKRWRQKAANVNYVQVVEDLSQCLTKEKPIRLYSAGFASHDHNLNGRALADIFGRLEVSDLWRKIGADPEIMAHFGTQNVETTANAGSEKLNSFIEIRNQIAHRGPNYQTVGSSVVLEYVAFFRLLVPALADVLQNHLAKFP